MTDKRELKPCPFCRRPGRLDNDMPNAVVGCSATTHSCPGIAACVSSSADEAITAWNTRLASGDAVKQLAEAIFHNGPVLVDTMGDDLAWQDDHRNWHILTTEAPASDEKGKVRDTPGLRASRESLGITQDEQRRRAMAAASRMKAKGTASKPGPATTEAPAPTDENGKLTQPPPDRTTPEERERRVAELVAKLAAYQEADKAPAQTEQGGERADLQGQKQSADTTATPPTSAQTEAMALAVERLGFTIEERAGVDVVVYGGKEAGCRPANMNELALWSELQAALRQPASVEAGWIVLNGQGDRYRCWGIMGPEWTDDRSKATRYARKQDAEAVHEHDEDAWSIKPFAASVEAEPVVQADTWTEAVKPLVARFETAAKFNVDAVQNGEGADAIAKLLTAMAHKLDFGDDHFVPRAETARLEAEIERLRGELARRDRNETRNCINWGPCSAHDGRMADIDPIASALAADTGEG